MRIGMLAVSLAGARDKTARPAALTGSLLHSNAVGPAPTLIQVTIDPSIYTSKPRVSV